MALDAALLKSLTEHMAPEDAKVFENLTTKYKPLEEGYLRQSDYDRFMNKTKTELDDAKAKQKEWEDWAKDNVPIHQNLIKSYEDLEKKNKEFEAQLAEAQAARAAAGEGEVDAAELARRVQEEVNKLGFASKGEIDKIINEQASKLAREEATKEIAAANDRFFKETVPGITNFTMDAAEIAYDHKVEFGASLDRAKFSEFMKERNLLDPKKAYEEFVRPQRDAKKLEEEVSSRVKAREEELRQQYSAHGMPGGGGVPNGLQPKGAMQMKIERDEAAKQGSMATSVAAQQAAAELRNEGRM